jgi:hypothetical protein
VKSARNLPALFWAKHNSANIWMAMAFFITHRHHRKLEQPHRVHLHLPWRASPTLCSGKRGHPCLDSNALLLIEQWTQLLPAARPTRPQNQRHPTPAGHNVAFNTNSSCVIPRFSGISYAEIEAISLHREGRSK